MSAINPNRRTAASASYLTERGLQRSASLLEKLRTRGPDDPRDRGPDFTRDERGVCWYSQEALDKYLRDRLASRQFRAPASQPANFRGSRRASGSVA